MDRILIEGLRVETIIGVHDWERSNKQEVVLDIDVGKAVENAATSDRLDDTVSYGDIARSVTTLVAKSRCELIETLAEQVASLLLDEFAIEDVRLKLSKPGAIENASRAAVVIHRERQ